MLSSLRRSGKSLRVALRSSGPGRLRIAGVHLRTTTRELRGAGLYRVAVRLTPKAQRSIVSKGRLSVRVRVSLSPPFGRSAAKTYRRTVRS